MLEMGITGCQTLHAGVTNKISFQVTHKKHTLGNIECQTFKEMKDYFTANITKRQDNHASLLQQRRHR